MPKPLPSIGEERSARQVVRRASSSKKSLSTTAAAAAAAAAESETTQVEEIDNSDDKNVAIVADVNKKAKKNRSTTFMAFGKMKAVSNKDFKQIVGRGNAKKFFMDNTPRCRGLPVGAFSDAVDRKTLTTYCAKNNVDQKMIEKLYKNYQGDIESAFHKDGSKKKWYDMSLDLMLEPFSASRIEQVSEPRAKQTAKAKRSELVTLVFTLFHSIPGCLHCAVALVQQGVSWPVPSRWQGPEGNVVLQVHYIQLRAGEEKRF